MDAIVVAGMAIGLLLTVGWLAAHAGVDSRQWPVSDEERLAGFGFTWGDSTPAAVDFADHTRLRLADLRREADAERLVQVARLTQSLTPRTALARPRRSLRARIAVVLATLAARVDRTAALEGLF